MRDWEGYIRELEEEANEAREEERRLRQMLLDHGFCPDDEDGDHMWVASEEIADALECLNCKTEAEGDQDEA